MSAMDYNALALAMHSEHRGKIEIRGKVPVRSRDDLSTAYTPGVAEPCRRIAADPDAVWEYTTKGNMVAVVTDGTAVLGLGDIGPLAALPVMEGKALLFKEFAGVDAVPVCLDTKDAGEIVKTAFLDAAPELKNRHWYFAADGFHIVFDPYEIAPYAAGSITAAVPYSELGGVIKEEYLPEELRGIQASGTPKLKRWDELDRQDKTRYNGGSIYGMPDESYKAVTTDETAYHARVQKDYNVVFYSSRMMPNDVAWMNDMVEIDKMGGEAEYLITSETNLNR